MLRIAMSALLGLLVPASVSAPLPVHIGGRVVAGPDGALRFGWPGVYVEGRFRGSSVAVDIDNGADHLRILIDGIERKRVTAPGRATETFSGLPHGDHVVRVEKLTESQSGSTRFLGFHADGPALPAQPRARRVEFIGDSHTVGYGNTSPKRECTRDEVHDTTDTQQAFGPLLARRLGADYRVTAYSGYGVVRNYGGAVPGESLPTIYWRSIPGEPALTNDIDWRPQLIVINLGTNDFSTPLKPGEAWADAAALRKAWRERYAEFVGGLRIHQPQAQFLLLGAADFYADVEAVAAAVALRGFRPVETLRLPPLELTGCDWHPSLKDHVVMADLVQARIARIEGGILW